MAVLPSAGQITLLPLLHDLVDGKEKASFCSASYLIYFLNTTFALADFVVSL